MLKIMIKTVITLSPHIVKVVTLHTETCYPPDNYTIVDIGELAKTSLERFKDNNVAFTSVQTVEVLWTLTEE